MEEEIGVKVTRRRRRLSIEAEDIQSPSAQLTQNKKRGSRLAVMPQLELIDEIALTKNRKKRKERHDDIGVAQSSKAIKQNYFDEVHVPRLPTNVLRQLDDTQKKNEQKQQLISTISFSIHETRQDRNKPSHYLEQSVCLNESIEEETIKQAVKTPKVLPFIPTASTSDHGFTTKFTVNVISQVTEFVAKPSDVSNFENGYLQKNRIKKMGAFVRYKRQRNNKKFGKWGKCI